MEEMILMILMFAVMIIGLLIYIYSLKTKISVLKQEMTALNEILDMNIRNQEISANRIESYMNKINELNSTLSEIEREQSKLNVTIDDMYVLHDYAKLFRRYKLNYEIFVVYVNNRRKLDIHVHCTMSNYTKMSLNDDLNDNITYHIIGSNLTLTK